MKMLWIAPLLMLSFNVMANQDPTICGNDDDRTLSYDPAIARMGKGCTATLISDDCMVSAGHCTSTFTTAEFNTPLSSRSGRPQASKTEDRYPVDTAKLKYVDGGIGNDWAVFKIKSNKATGKTAGSAQAAVYKVRLTAAAVGDQLRITGYGVDNSRRGKTSQAQRTHLGKLTVMNGGKLGYRVDTTGGNSGSAVLLESTKEIIGIHTHGGCRSSGSTNHNSGTSLSANSAFKAAVKACMAKTGIFKD